MQHFIFTCSITNALLQLKQLGEVLLQRRLCGVDVDVHVARGAIRHRVHLVIGPSGHLRRFTSWLTHVRVELQSIKSDDGVKLYLYLLTRLQGVVLFLLHHLHIQVTLQHMYAGVSQIFTHKVF